MRDSMHENNETHGLHMLNAICNENIKLHLQLRSKKNMHTLKLENHVYYVQYICTMGLHTQTHTNIVY